MTAEAKLTVRDAAARLGVSDDTVRKLVHARKLGCVRVGVGEKKAPMRFTEAHLSAYIAANSTGPAEEPTREPETVRVPARRTVLELPEANRYV